MRSAYPVTVPDRREALHGSAEQAADWPDLRLAQPRVCLAQLSVNKLQPSMLKGYHKF